MQSCFTDRLAKIRKMIMDSGSLPTRPSRISDAWRREIKKFTRDGSHSNWACRVQEVWKKWGHTVCPRGRDWLDRVHIVPKARLDKDTSCHGWVLDDDVIGVTGYFTESGRLRASDLHRPSLGAHQKATSGSDAAISVAFLSDIHVGSKTFLDASGKRWSSGSRRIPC